jgi:hypothetical protein
MRYIGIEILQVPLSCGFGVSNYFSNLTKTFMFFKNHANV